MAEGDMIDRDNLGVISLNVVNVDMLSAPSACSTKSTVIAHESLPLRLTRKYSEKSVILCSEIAEKLAHVQYHKCKKMKDIHYSKPRVNRPSKSVKKCFHMQPTN